jgi:hypothetical protein
MKQLTFFLFTLQFFTATAAVKDTIPANIKNYSKEQFLKEFGKDETSEKLIHYYFYRSKKAKQSIFIFSGLTLLTGAYIGLLANESRTPTKHDDYTFLALLGAGGIAAMFLSVTAEAAGKRKNIHLKICINN